MFKGLRFVHVTLALGSLLLAATVVIGLVAVWTINQVTQGHLAGTAAILGITGFLTAMISAAVLSS